MTCPDCPHELDLHKRQANGAYRCTSFGCGCEIASPDDERPRRRLTRHERHQLAADAGVDTWEDYEGER